MSSAALALPADVAAKPRPWLAAASLARRELVRFLRQRNRVVGAMLTPIVFWLLIGAGMGRSFAGGAASGNAASPDLALSGGVATTGGQTYLEYFFPGAVLMVLLFTAIFSTISIIEDRREGFMQGVLVAPVPRWSVVLGKVIGGTVLAVGQAMVLLLLAPLAGVQLTVSGVALAAVMMLVIAFALTALGLAIAWPMESTAGFHAIMNLFLMPMWFLSGALFPPQGAMGGLAWVMALNPLSYGLAGIRRGLYPADAVGGLPSVAVCLAVTLAFAAVTFSLATVTARRSRAS